MSVIRTIRKKLRPIRRFTEAARTRLVELPYRMRHPSMGSAEWLIRSEIVYGGIVSDVPRRRISPNDNRSAEQLATGGMTGGDRMLHNGYAATYAHFLAPFQRNRQLMLAEFGILKGTGLSIWCDLFPNGRIIGLDIDLQHFVGNRAELLRRGAFTHNQPEVYEYDQLVDNRELLACVLNGRTLDIVIDDGLHSIESIVTTWRSVAPYLSPRFVYFIEDYGNLLDVCAGEFGGFDCHVDGILTVISAGVST